MKLISPQIHGPYDDIPSELFNKMVKEKELAIDGEFSGLQPWRDSLLLIQIASLDNTVCLIKPNKESSNLRAILENQKITKVFHFAVVDCSMILTNLNVMVQNPYCTKIASKIARTYSEEHSLSVLIKEAFDVQIDKSQQASDWSLVLDSNQREYAAQDVVYLLPLKVSLEEKLKRRGFLRTGISLFELNNLCQAFIPAYTHLSLNGWTMDNLSNGERNAIFKH